MKTLKKIVLLLPILFIHSCSSKEEPKECFYPKNFEENIIIGYGNIKSIEERDYDTKEYYDSYVKKELLNYRKYKFDKNHRIIQYDDGDNYREVYEYNDSSILIKKYSHKRPTWEIVINLNSIGKCKKEVLKARDGNITTNEYLYDSYKNLIEIRRNGQIKESRQIKYIDNEISTIKYSESYRVDPYFSFDIYDSLKYNYENNKTILYFNPLKHKVMSKTYNENGRVDTIFSRNSKDGIGIIRIYDKKGNIIKEGDNLFKYEYDEKGNWIKKEIYRPNDYKPLMVTIREITYY